MQTSRSFGLNENLSIKNKNKADDLFVCENDGRTQCLQLKQQKLMSRSSMGHNNRHKFNGWKGYKPIAHVKPLTKSMILVAERNDNGVQV